MGKLAELWTEYKKTPAKSQRKIDIQKEINKIERWMIGKGYKKEGTQTDWAKYKPAKTMPQKDKYGDILNENCKEHDVRRGRDRCDACVYNKNPNCCMTCHETGALLSWISV